MTGRKKPLDLQQSLQKQNLNLQGLASNFTKEFALPVNQSLQMVIAGMKLKDAYSLEEKL